MNVWELVVQQPMINILIVLTSYLANSFGLAIIILTIVVNVLMFPLTMKQIKASKAMQDLQPKLAELQRKHAKDRQKLAQEQMQLYKESGMNPAGCLLPMLIQMPIWIALYQSVMLSLAIAPEGLLNLSQYLYSWPVVYTMLPLGNDFLWLDLASPNMVLAILVGATMWMQQKMSMTVSADSKQAQQARMMLWMMPMMFTFLALSFPSGLALFWVTSSTVRIVMQYRVSGWGGLVPSAVSHPAGDRDKKYVKFAARSEEESVAADVEADIMVTDDEQAGKGRGLSYPASPEKTRFQPGKERRRHHKKK
ncbi:YidC/Oxa1 family membrane protein insertase [Chloroflexota bacterium]